eukprot:Awhi_evm2s2122
MVLNIKSYVYPNSKLLVWQRNFSTCKRQRVAKATIELKNNFHSIDQPLQSKASRKYHQQQHKQQLENPDDFQWSNSVNLRNNCHHQCKHTRQQTDFNDIYGWKEAVHESNNDAYCRDSKTKNGITKSRGNRLSAKAIHLQRAQLVERLLQDIDQKNSEIQKSIHELKSMLL